MKRAVCMLMLLVCALAGAQAETYTYERDGQAYLTVENFEEELSDRAREIFAGLLTEDDEVLCGTLYMELYRAYEGASMRGRAALAVIRDGKVLVMGAYRDDTWNTVIETDSFFGIEDEFTIRTNMKGSAYSDAQMVIECAGEIFELSSYTNGALAISACEAMEYGGLEIACHSGQFSWKKKTQEGMELWETQRGVVPARLAAWTYESFPRNVEEIGAWIATHPLELDENEAYMSGVNFREKPTGESKSWGKYTAKVRVLGSERGVQAPWYHVQLGDVMGWCSGDYLETAEDDGPFEVHAAASSMAKVGRARTETALVSMPDGERVMSLATGTLVHVLGERDGWLHVIVPENELTWQTDWDGTYGFVKSGDMAVGISQADAMYKN